MKKLTSFSDSGHRFPLEEPTFYFTAKSCWLVLLPSHKPGCKLRIRKSVILFLNTFRNLHMFILHMYLWISSKGPPYHWLYLDLQCLMKSRRKNGAIWSFLPLFYLFMCFEDQCCHIARVIHLWFANWQSSEMLLWMLLYEYCFVGL